MTCHSWSTLLFLKAARETFAIYQIQAVGSCLLGSYLDYYVYINEKYRLIRVVVAGMAEKSGAKYRQEIQQVGFYPLLLDGRAIYLPTYEYISGAL